jgi:hypothetical protein
MPKTRKYKGSPAGIYEAVQMDQRLQEYRRYRSSCGSVKTTRIEDLTPDQRERLGL